MIAFVEVLILLVGISVILTLAGIVSDWLWPWLEAHSHANRRQATYRNR